MAAISPIHPFKFPRLGILELLQNRRGGVFERLPTEILVNILLRLDDLASLDCLLHASPVAYRIFDEFAVKVAETILHNGYGAARKGLHTKEPTTIGIAVAFVPMQIHLIAMIRSGTLPLNSLSDFVGRVIIPYQIGMDVVSLGLFQPESRAMPTVPFVPPPLAEDTPPAIVRGLVSTARHLTSLSIDCLKFYRARFGRMKPCHPTVSAKQFESMPPETRKDLHMEPWHDQPRGRRVPVHDIGSPTWLEEQLVIRAFWCLQTIVDIRKAATASSSRLVGEGWLREDLKQLRDWKRHNVYSLEKLLRTLLGRATVCRTLASSIQYRQMMAIMHYLEAAHQRSWPDPHLTGQQRLEVKRDWPAPRRRRRDLERLGRPSKAHHLYDFLQSNSYTSLGSLAPYNALGFAVWSDERMGAASLVSSRAMSGGGLDEFRRYRFTYAWLSVLGADDRRALEGFRRKQGELAAKCKDRTERQAMEFHWVPYLMIDLG
ncbi:uncharacterized protein PG986_004882 [Apiospora aurea]|uniref:F-box domain-containing protein n=1 Tax=Apiospora aurea TaxID=335848 RepID=A0ABR1QG92_9PEZI